ncbi:MAG: HlyC/CorC family transporter [Chlamydiae bacterium]|nr:HlyC/CorC family transporter [Chlamydiota bacterium]
MNVFELIIVLLLISSSLLINFKTALSRFGMIDTEKEFQKYRKYYAPLVLLRKIKPRLNWDQFLDFINIHIQIYRLTLTLFISFELFKILDISPTFFHLFIILLTILSIIISLELLMRILAIAFPLFSIKLLGYISGLMLIALFPITYPIVLLQDLFSAKQEIKNQKLPSIKFKTKVQEFIHNLDLNHAISIQEKKLLLAIASFRDRIAREIMVPRVDVYTVSIKKTIQECAKEFVKEGYSRIPVYDETVDNIIGVILSKDILDYLIRYQTEPHLHPLSKSIKTLIKPVLFAPETKKISNLFQEFKSSQIHLAIIVDEYGGTEGIVTIEDILEELVGEIEDEYDIEEHFQFHKDSSGAYIIDAKTSLLEIENQTGLLIPQAQTYDTIGGFIVNVAGSIPKKGWKVHYDTFNLEILSGDEKSIEKVKITPINNENN